jgi:hypothetical protein
VNDFFRWYCRKTRLDGDVSQLKELEFTDPVNLWRRRVEQTKSGMMRASRSGGRVSTRR